MGDLIWLTVGGCPRSGTSALGGVLNRHAQVALLHEYDQVHFFRSVAAFFREEERLGVYADSSHFALIPRRARHEIEVVRALMRVFTGRDARLIGTKFPCAHLWPQPQIPDGIVHKEMHITRAPHAVIASYAKKMVRDGHPGGYGDMMDTAIAHWVSAWNHAIDRRDDADFLHLFYERLGEDGDTQTPERIADFLGVEGSEAFDFSD